MLLVYKVSMRPEDKVHNGLPWTLIEVSETEQAAVSQMAWAVVGKLRDALRPTGVNREQEHTEDKKIKVKNL